MIRNSPENEVGLTDAMKTTQRIKTFTLKESLIPICFRFLLLLCILVGFTVWWNYLPLGMDRFNVNCLNSSMVKSVKIIRGIKSRVLHNLQITELDLTDAILQEVFGEEVVRTILRETFDPLKTLPSSLGPSEIIEAKNNGVALKCLQ